VWNIKMAMIATLFITSTTGDVLIEKQCTEKVTRDVLEEFWSAAVYPARSLNVVPTVTQLGRYCVVQVNTNDVMLLGVNASDVPPMTTVEFLSALEEVLSVYLKELRAEAVRDNFSLVYQVLEEMIDSGAPLTTEVGQLEQLVPRPTLENRVRSIIDAPAKKTRAGEGQVPWRGPGISYATNEIFFDLTDYLDVTIDADGKVVKADMRGEVVAQCRLSGMPDVVMRLTGTDAFDDVCLHKSVRLSRYESDRTISLVPPDGYFNLLRYRSKSLLNYQPPFYVSPQITFHKDGGRINVMVGLRHGGIGLTADESNIHKLTVTRPMPQQTETVSISTCSQGQCSYDNLRKQVVWKIGHLHNTTPTLSGEVIFKSSAGDVTEGSSESIFVDFQIPNYSLSGTRVASVSVPNEAYKPFKGVKYMTKAGRYIIRTA
jgi:AP-3 complex subunit mu